MYKLAFDVYYKNNTAKAAGILFKDWQDKTPSQVLSKELYNIKPYQPGSFYKRELPCILAVLGLINLQQVEVIIIDGYVYLDDNNSLGLGGHLFNAINETVPVIGVAKTKFYNNNRNVMEVKRGNSSRPLYITAIGIEVNIAAGYIQSMAGEHRIPDILKQLDRLTKE